MQFKNEVLDSNREEHNCSHQGMLLFPSSVGVCFLLKPTWGIILKGITIIMIFKACNKFHTCKLHK